MLTIQTRITLIIIMKITTDPITNIITIIILVTTTITIRDDRITTTSQTDPRTKAEITHHNSTAGLIMFRPTTNQVEGDTTLDAIVSVGTEEMQGADDGGAIASRGMAATMTTGHK